MKHQVLNGGQSPILLVEDDVLDQKAVNRAVNKLGIPNPLLIAGNGKQALQILQDPNVALPALILLDINMPLMNGLEFLYHIKADKKTKMIPTVMLSTSTEECDRVDSYNLGVAGYIAKPVNHRGFVDIIRHIYEYWSLNELAPSHSS